MVEHASDEHLERRRDGMREQLALGEALHRGELEAPLGEILEDGGPFEAGEKAQIGEEMQRQIATLAFYSNAVYSPVRAEAAEALGKFRSSFRYGSEASLVAGIDAGLLGRIAHCLSAALPSPVRL